MKILKPLLVSVILLSLVPALAKEDKKTVFSPKTEHNFNELDVNGRYQTPMEAVVTIENEKILDDLLGARTHFKDRLKKQAEMR